MARDIEKRLRDLNARRKGTDRLDRLAEGARLQILAKSLVNEQWERRSVQQPYTRYALGAMEAVGAEYTRISVETAERVGRQLNERLPMPVSFELQGSVPLNVHIRGVSDVDLLTLDGRFVTYDRFGSQSGTYYPSSLTSVSALEEVRSEVEKALRAAYPAVTVDCSGGKCIAISGGSLARPVDVVPSHWHDNSTYQSTMQKRDRGVTILDRKKSATLDQLPFLHIDRVSSRDAQTVGGLRKAIRLVKNIKNDAVNQEGAAKLPSFDIAALLYHADVGALALGRTHELAVLHEAQRFLDWCWTNKELSRQLRTPDGLRPVLNTAEKFEGLLTVSCELDSLVKEVVREQAPSLRGLEPTDAQITAVLRSSVLPAAA